jgi:hypothetical protein
MEIPSDVLGHGESKWRHILNTLEVNKPRSHGITLMNHQKESCNQDGDGIVKNCERKLQQRN